MKKQLVHFAIRSVLVFTLIFIWTASRSQSTDKEKRLVQDSKDAIKDFLHTDPSMQKLLDNSYGYVVFPSVGKGAVGVGGASGGGILFQKVAPIGKAQLTQVTIGFQFGGQAYREVIFFENKDIMDHFKENKVEFSAQVSAVAATAGASGNAKYTDGIMIFTQQKGGLMYEASVGGQKFKYSPFTK